MIGNPPHRPAGGPPETDKDGVGSPIPAITMALTLEQYARYLDTRDLVWPAPPEPRTPKARPHLAHLPHIKLVTWNVYGTLLSIAGGDLYFSHPQKLIMDLALEKTVQEFK